MALGTGLDGFVEFLKQPFLFPVELNRRLDHHAHQKIARGAAPHRLDALASHPEQLAALGAGRHLEVDLAFEGRDFKFTAERRLGKGEWNFADQVIPFSLEDRMLLDRDDHVEVPRWATLGAGLSFAVHFQPVARFYPGRDLQGKGLLPTGQAGPAAVGAGVGNLFAFAVAVRTGTGQGKKALLKSDNISAGQFKRPHLVA